MITRDVRQLQVVPAFVHVARFVDFSGTVGTCACAGGIAGAGSTYFPGFVIDRLGLEQNYRALMIAPVAYGEANSTDETAKTKYHALSMGLQHTSATGGTWADYSTGSWLENVPFWQQTTATATSTASGGQFYTPVQRDAADSLGRVMTTATSTSAFNPSTSTGNTWYAGPGPVFDLGGAKRYIRCLIKPIFENALACGALGMRVSAAAIFGEPDYAQPMGGLGGPSGSLGVAPIKRILVTTMCST